MGTPILAQPVGVHWGIALGDAHPSSTRGDTQALISMWGSRVVAGGQEVLAGVGTEFMVRGTGSAENPR